MLFGKYCLLERVSVGGMAEVFRAKPFHVPQGRRYLALKRILPHLAENDEFIQMFIDEAKLTVQLRHKNIVQIYELGQFQSSYYILMEYIAGQDLLALQKLARRDRSIMSVAQACFIAQELSRGMDYAHRKVDAQGSPLNIIHRDISPQNVLVSYEGEVKVIDFGIAKAAAQNTHTQVGVLKGKFGYMSPEQVQGMVLDRRSDVFAIGTVFWELLTNRRLFKGENEFDTLQKVRNPQIDPPSTKNPEIPPEVDRIVMRALAPNREERYQWASELADELERYLAALTPAYQQSHLAHWMEESFSEEVDLERAKHEKFRVINDPDDVRRSFVEAFGQGVPPGEDEAESGSTQIWDAEIAPGQGEDLNAFGANHTVVQAGGFDLEQFAKEQAALNPFVANSETFEQQLPSLPGLAPSAQPGSQKVDFDPSGTQPGSHGPAGALDQRVQRQILFAILSLVLLVGLLAVFLYLLAGKDQDRSSNSGQGIVVVDVFPPTNLEIFFAGIARASQAPTTIEGVMPGVHLLEIRHPDFETYQQPVTVADEGVLPLHVELKPRSLATGTLKLSWPESEEVALYIDGAIRSAENTPASFDLRKGERLVEIRSPGHRVWSKKVVIGAGEVTEVSVELVPGALSLEVTGRGNSVVRVNGKEEGRLPVEVSGLDPSQLHVIEFGRWRSVLGFPAVGEGRLDVSPGAKAHREDDYGWFTATTGQDWWRVYVDGVDTGLVTPIRLNQKVPLLAGKHTIAFKRGDRSVEVEVEVGAGETVVIRENLTFEVP